MKIDILKFIDECIEQAQAEKDKIRNGKHDEINAEIRAYEKIEEFVENLEEDE
jgi:hypothetical protein